MFVYLSVSFSVKDFSRTTWLMVLKFGTKFGNDKLYGVLKIQLIAYQSIYICKSLFLLNK